MHYTVFNFSVTLCGAIIRFYWSGLPVIKAAVWENEPALLPIQEIEPYNNTYVQKGFFDFF